MPPKKVGNTSAPYSMKLHFMPLFLQHPGKEGKATSRNVPLRYPELVIRGPFISVHSKTIILTCAVARISFDSEMLGYLRKNPVIRLVLPSPMPTDYFEELQTKCEKPNWGKKGPSFLP